MPRPYRRYFWRFRLLCPLRRGVEWAHIRRNFDVVDGAIDGLRSVFGAWFGQVRCDDCEVRLRGYASHLRHRNYEINGGARR